MSVPRSRSRAAVSGPTLTPAQQLPGRRDANNIRRVIRRLLLPFGLAFLALAPVARAAISQTPAITDTRYSSYLLAVRPSAPGVHWRVIHTGGGLELVLGAGRTVQWNVIDLNDEIRLINHSGEKVTVFGYSQSDRNVAYDGGEYAQILANGTVQLNENSPAYYENQSFYETGVVVPPSASATAAPDWVTFAKTGTLYWHDHRIHYTTPVIPTFIKNRGVQHRQFVFDWYVPIAVGSTDGYLYGALYWNGEKPFAFPIAAIVAFIVIVVAGAAFVVFIRRRRRPVAPGEAF